MAFPARPTLVLACAAAFVSILTACAGTPRTTSATATSVQAPADPPLAAPETVGGDSAPPMHMFDLRSLRVLKDGRLVFERYSNGLTRGHNHELYPVTKTITALTFGVPEGQGKISIGDRAAAWIVKAHPEFKARLADKQEIRLGSLMAMSSGRLCQPVEGSAPQNLHATRASSEHRPTPQTPRNSDIQHEIPRI